MTKHRYLIEVDHERVRGLSRLDRNRLNNCLHSATSEFVRHGKCSPLPLKTLRELGVEIGRTR